MKKAAISNFSNKSPATNIYYKKMLNWNKQVIFKCYIELILLK